MLLRHAIGSVLRRRRLARGQTLRELAEQSRVSLPYLSEIERGRKEASSEILGTLCRVLDLTEQQLLVEVGEEFATQRASSAALTAVGWRERASVSERASSERVSSERASVSERGSLSERGSVSERASLSGRVSSGLSEAAPQDAIARVHELASTYEIASALEPASEYERASALEPASEYERANALERASKRDIAVQSDSTHVLLAA